jgi:hypothetical protein
MICHKNKVIFIHIPKCAGSSVETAFGVKPFSLEYPNFSNLTGWDRVNGIFLQHTSVNDLFEYNLVDKEKIDNFYKFTIVRNPWDRALSSYLSLINDTKINDTFENFIFKKGKYKNVLTIKNINYRGDYLKSQTYYIENNYGVEMDSIIKFESLFKVNDVLKNVGLNKTLPHINKTYNKDSYKYFYRKNPSFIDMVSEVYKKDIEAFNYSLIDLNLNL